MIPNAKEPIVVKNPASHANNLADWCVHCVLENALRKNKHVVIDLLDFPICIDKLLDAADADYEGRGGGPLYGNKYLREQARKDDVKKYCKDLYEYVKQYVVPILTQRLEDKGWQVQIKNESDPPDYVFAGLGMSETMVIDVQNVVEKK